MYFYLVGAIYRAMLTILEDMPHYWNLPCPSKHGVTWKSENYKHLFRLKTVAKTLYMLDKNYTTELQHSHIIASLWSNINNVFFLPFKIQVQVYL